MSVSRQPLSLVDVGVLVLSACAMLISVYQEGVLNLDKAWWQSSGDATGASYRTGGPSSAEKMPPPLVVDVDGDGLNELVLVTREPKLKILSGGAPRGLEARPYTVLQETSLLPKTVSLSAGRQALALGAGYIAGYNNDTNRQMVIVVMTAAWHVLCFNHKLDKLWERALPVSASVHNQFLGEVAVLVTAHGLQPADRGAVIVGGRLHQGDDELNNLWQREVEANAEETLTDDGSHGRSKEEHFSYFAFEGAGGQERWHNKASDFYSETTSTNLLHPQHSTHAGESDWRRFRHNFLESLPHFWHARDDTRFELGRFERRRSGNDRQEEIKTRSLPPLALSRPHSDSEHVAHPNVIVAHLKAGIEVLHLSTGRPVAHLTLGAGSTHADIDGDGVIDHITAYGREAMQSARGGRENAELSCVAVVSSTTPALHTLFRANLCPNAISSVVHPTSEILVAPPLVVRQSHPSLGVSGPSAWHREPSLFKIFFLVSTGHVSCYSKSGELLWQTATTARWGVGTADSMPSMTPFKLRPDDLVEEFVLASAASSLVLLKASNGQIMSNVILPGPSLGVSVGDFSGDGYNDVIVTTTKGTIGFALRRTLSAQILTVLLGFLVATLLVVFGFKLSQGLKIQPQKREAGYVRHLGPRARVSFGKDDKDS